MSRTGGSRTPVGLIEPRNRARPPPRAERGNLGAPMPTPDRTGPSPRWRWTPPSTRPAPQIRGSRTRRPGLPTCGADNSTAMPRSPPTCAAYFCAAVESRGLIERLPHSHRRQPVSPTLMLHCKPRPPGNCCATGTDGRSSTAGTTTCGPASADRQGCGPAGRGHLPPRRAPLGRALQHLMPALLLRRPQPHRRREPHHGRWDEPRGITITPGVQGPGRSPATVGILPP